MRFDIPTCPRRWRGKGAKEEIDDSRRASKREKNWQNEDDSTRVV